jgi:hypothetical protein
VLLQPDPQARPAVEKVLSFLKALGGQKVGVPIAEVSYRGTTEGDNKVRSKRVAIYGREGSVFKAFDIDRVNYNAGVLFDWAAKTGRKLPYTGVNDPSFIQDLGVYLRNQAESRRGSGEPLFMGGKPPISSGTPVATLPREKEQFLSITMGEKAKSLGVTKSALAIARQKATAQASGVTPVETAEGLFEPNSLRDGYRKAGAPLDQINADPDPVRRQANPDNRNETTMRLAARGILDFKLTGQSTSIPNTAAFEASFQPSASGVPVPPETPRVRFSNEDVRRVAQGYVARTGIPYRPHASAIPVKEELAKRIADFYDAAVDSPTAPEVRKAYQALANETVEQWKAFEKAGYTAEPWTGEGQPYADSAEMMADVKNNKHLFYFKTEDGFGSGITPEMRATNPMLAQSGVTFGSAQNVPVNDVFRVVHDLVGHGAHGYEFGPKGEFNAYLEHSRMFSNDAKPALAAETLAQNSWVNYGPHLRRTDGTLPKKGEDGFVPISQRRFADQKNIVIPQEILDETDAYAAEQTGIGFVPAKAEDLGTVEQQTARAEEALSLAAPKAEGAVRFQPAGKIDSPEFKKWFGGSKILNSRGEPLRVFHGTSATPFDAFDREKIGSSTDTGMLGEGFYFSVSPETASAYAFPAGDVAVEDVPLFSGARVIPAFLSIQNPAFGYPESFGQSLAGKLAAQVGDGTLSPTEMTSALKKRGYDGVVWLAGGPNSQIDGYRGNEVVVFSPEQVKSAISPTFDPTNPARFMPALAKEKAKGSNVQFKSKAKKGSKGGIVDLVHFSSKNLTEIDPKKSFGKGAATPTDRQGMNKAFFYVKGTAYEGPIATRPNIYEAQVDGNSLYDYNEDALGVRSNPNREARDKAIKDAGFVGYFVETEGFDAVAIFDPVKVKASLRQDVMTPRQMKNLGLEKQEAPDPVETRRQERLVELRKTPSYKRAEARIAERAGSRNNGAYFDALFAYEDAQLAARAPRPRKGNELSKRATPEQKAARFVGLSSRTPRFQPSGELTGATVRKQRDPLGLFPQAQRTLDAIPEKATRQQIEAAFRDGVKEKGQIKERPVRKEELEDIKTADGLSLAQFLKDNPTAGLPEIKAFVRDASTTLDRIVLQGAGKQWEFDGETFDTEREAERARERAMDAEYESAYESEMEYRQAYAEGDKLMADDGGTELYEIRENEGEEGAEPTFEVWDSQNDELLESYDEKWDAQYRMNALRDEYNRNIEVEVGDYGDEVPDIEETGSDGDGVQYADYTLRGGDSDTYKEVLFTVEGGAYPRYTSNHFQDATDNYLAHARVDDGHRTSDGKSVYLVEEIQSDRHQAARDEGYDIEPPQPSPEQRERISQRIEENFARQDELDRASSEAASTLGRKSQSVLQRLRAILTERFPALASDNDAGLLSMLGSTRPNEGNAEIVALRDEFRAARVESEAPFWAAQKNREELASLRREMRPVSTGSIPDAPFKKSWKEMVFKSLLTEAVQEGKDVFAWTPGDKQAARYSNALQKAVDTVETKKNPDGTYDATFYKNTRVVSEEKAATPTRLSDLVGKAAATKIVSEADAANGEFATVDGANLSVGGEGMRAVYDRVLVNFANDYLKKYGVKVGEVQLKLPRADTSVNVNPKVWGFEIPEKLRQDVAAEGLPRYQPSAQAARKGDLSGERVQTRSANNELAKARAGRFSGFTGAAPAVVDTAPEGWQSTRFPTATKATENPVEQKLIIGLDALLRAPDVLKKQAAVISKYPPFKGASKSPEKVVEALRSLAESNLVMLHDLMPPGVRARAKKWYDGGRVIADRFAEQYGHPVEATAGVLAALSPQMDWFRNVDLARRVLDETAELEKTTVTKRQADWLMGKLAQDTPTNAVKREAVKASEGKKFADLGLLEKAMFLRANDELKGQRSLRIVTPEGDFGDVAKYKTAWGGFGTIAKAIGMLQDPSYANISRSLGMEHKVRNFYNNLLLPNSPLGDVTIDTHAVAAALLAPLAGTSAEVQHNLGGAAGSSILGISGTYPIYADAYRSAAAKLGLLPRELQSITWEAVRGLFDYGFKRSGKAGVSQLWKDYAEGKTTLEETQQKIVAAAGGINLPSWYE